MRDEEDDDDDDEKSFNNYNNSLKGQFRGIMGKKKLRIAIFIENNEIMEHLQDLLVWDFFLQLDEKKKKEIYVETVYAKEIGEGILREKRFDVIMMPGGDGEDQASFLGEGGKEKLIEFVENGGGYVGLCAGSYLALTAFPDSNEENLIKRRIIDSSTKDWHFGLINLTSSDLGNWNRGEGNVFMEFTKEGKDLLKVKEDVIEVYYANGPIIRNLPENWGGKIVQCKGLKILAFYRSEKSRSTSSKGKMVNSPSVAVGHYGKGRVVVMSPHLEKYPEDIAAKYLFKLIQWSADRC